MLKQIKLAQFKTLPKKKWGFFRSFFDDTRGYHVRKPSLGITHLIILLDNIFIIFYLRFGVYWKMKVKERE